MMAQKTQLKPTALLLALVYLFLSGSMTFGAVQHDLIHEHHADHSKQHTSLACDWMCTASAFVHSGHPPLTHSFQFSFERTVVRFENFFANLSIFSLYIRPPPLSLS